MRSKSLRLWMIGLWGMTLWACSPKTDCIKLTPTSRGCSSPKWFAEPPPAAQVSQETSSSWTLPTSERMVPGYATLRETIWMVARPPHGQYDHIALHRITQAAEGNGSLTRPVFLFLPGPHLHGETIIPDERYDLRLYLANRGVETWTLDYRMHFIPREQIYDSVFMQPWTTEAFVEDVAAAARFVQETSRAQKIFAGGFGRGVTFAYLYAARHWRDDLLGLVILDGYALDPPDAFPLYVERSPTPNWFADDLEARLPYKRWMKILQDVIDDPSGPDFFPQVVAPVNKTGPDGLPVEPMFNSRAEALAYFLSVGTNFLFVSPDLGGRGGLSNAKEGYADVSILARILLHQDRYWPRVQNHGGFELHRHLAEAAFDYETALHEMKVPILAFANGNVGPEWEEQVEYSARATAAQDVEHQVLHHWGHLDVLFGARAAQEVFQPIVGWIFRHGFSSQKRIVSNETSSAGLR